MQILLAFLFGAVAGLTVHYTLPRRELRGVAVAPLIGAVASGAVWAGMTWAGAALDNPWLWIAAIVVPFIVTYPVVIGLDALRRRRDTAERARLGIG